MDGVEVPLQDGQVQGGEAVSVLHVEEVRAREVWDEEGFTASGGDVERGAAVDVAAQEGRIILEKELDEFEGGFGGGRGAGGEMQRRAAPFIAQAKVEGERVGRLLAETTIIVEVVGNELPGQVANEWQITGVDGEVEHGPPLVGDYGQDVLLLEGGDAGAGVLEQQIAEVGDRESLRIVVFL